MKNILATLLFICSFQVFCQKVYFVPYEHQANIVVYITNNKYEATDIIKIVKQKDQVRDKSWYICSQKDQADFNIFVTNYKWKASKVIYFEQW